MMVLMRDPVVKELPWRSLSSLEGTTKRMVDQVDEASQAYTQKLLGIDTPDPRQEELDALATVENN